MERGDLDEGVNLGESRVKWAYEGSKNELGTMIDDCGIGHYIGIFRIFTVCLL